MNILFVRPNSPKLDVPLNKSKKYIHDCLVEVKSDRELGGIHKCV